MAVGDNLTVSYYDIEALRHAFERADYDACEKILEKLVVDREAVE